MGAVLHHLEDAPKGAVLVAHCQVGDVDEQVWLVDPELGGFLLAATELVDDLAHDVGRLARVAVHDVAADHILASGEDAMLGVTVEAHKLVLVHIGEIDRQMLVDEVDLLQRERAFGNMKLGGGAHTAQTMLAEQLQKVLREIGRGALPLGAIVFRGLLSRINPREAYLVVACSHVSKLVRCKQDERGGVQDVLLLRDEVANVGDERRLHVDEPLLVRIEELTSRADLLPDKVIQGPHRRGGPVEALLLEHGIELVLFSGQVFLILFQPIVYAEPLVLDEGILDKILDGQADLLQLVVLCVVARDGVVVRKLWARAIDEAIEEGEHALDVLLLALPLLELLELLLRQGDLVRLDGVHPLA